MHLERRRPSALSPLVLFALAAGCAAGPPADPEIGTPVHAEPARGTFWLDGSLVELEYERVGDTLLFEGDIALDPEAEVPPGGGAEDVGGASAALLAEPRRNLWPRGVVPYVIGSSVTTPDRIRNAMREWERNTAIRFVPRRGQEAFVKFVEERGNTVCHSNVGYTGGRRVVSLRDTRIRSACSLGVVVHEIGHVLGLWHEHTRSDRNEHVRVIWDYVADRRQFQILSTGVRLVGPYDIRSTMHYRSFTLSSPSNRASIVRRDGSLILHDWADLSARDIASMERLYGSRDAAGGTEPDPAPIAPDDAGVDPVEPPRELDTPWADEIADAPEALGAPDRLPAPPVAAGCTAAGPPAGATPWLASALALIALIARRRTGHRGAARGEGRRRVGRAARR